MNGKRPRKNFYEFTSGAWLVVNMGINTDTEEMRQVLARLRKQVVDKLDRQQTVEVNLNDLSTLLAAYSIELNKNRKQCQPMSEAV